VNAPTRQNTFAALLRGVSEDVAAYEGLLLLLGQQFDAALQHQGARLGELATDIMLAVDTIELRRAARVDLLGKLLGPQGRMSQLPALLKGDTRARLEAEWQALEQMLLECKRLSSRNSSLLADQYSIMQRVLHGEEQIYAPG
jgi:flagella synthesis protein FlgN